MPQSSESPKIFLLTDDAAEESHTAHILAKYHFTNELVRVRKASDALKFFNAASQDASMKGMLPELIILSLRDSGHLNFSLAMESRRGALASIPLILVVNSPQEEMEVRGLNFELTACVTRPIGFFKLLEAMQKLHMRWIVLRPE